MTNDEVVQLLSDYTELASGLAEAKRLEAEARRKIVALLATPGKEEGAEKVMLVNGGEAKLEHVLNYNVSNKNGQVVYLQSIMPPDVFADLFRTKYEISVKAYRALSPAQREVVNYCLTITPGMPTLEYVPPSADRVI